MRDISNMFEHKNMRWWIAGAIALVVVAGFAVPRQASSVITRTGQPDASATVPASLIATDQTQNATTPSAGPSPSHIAVYVCGAVHRPGVYTFSSGLRVADGIARAGGALPQADLEQLNLAEPLADAMKIDVPKKGQIVANGIGELASQDQGYRATGRHRTRHSGRSSHKLQPGQVLDINTATESELTALPGVGPSLAARIVEYRNANGPFQTIDDLQNVSGIGPAKFDRMAPYIRL